MDNEGKFVLGAYSNGFKTDSAVLNEATTDAHILRFDPRNPPAGCILYDKKDNLWFFTVIKDAV